MIVGGPEIQRGIPKLAHGLKQSAALQQQQRSVFSDGDASVLDRLYPEPGVESVEGGPLGAEVEICPQRIGHGLIARTAQQQRTEQQGVGGGAQLLVDEPFGQTCLVLEAEFSGLYFDDLYEQEILDPSFLFGALGAVVDFAGDEIVRPDLLAELRHLAGVKRP